MKKKILALVLVIITTVAVCASCANKEAKQELADFTVINNTGESITVIALEDPSTGSKISVSPEKGGFPEGEATVISMLVAVDSKGNPNLKLSFTTESGYTTETAVNRKNVSITLKSREDGGGIEFGPLPE